MNNNLITKLVSLAKFAGDINATHKIQEKITYFYTCGNCQKLRRTFKKEATDRPCRVCVRKIIDENQLKLL